MKTIDWSTFGITVRDVFRNLHPAKLYEEAIRHEPSTTISSTGALIACSGVKTGRSPKDKRIVRQPDSERDVWWGPVNVAMEQLHFEINRERARDYLNTRDRLYAIDGFAGWDPTYRLKIRVICSRPYHALFMRTMLIRPSTDELANFGEPDYVIYNAGAFPANRLTAGMTAPTSIDLSLENREMVILGTEYAGEMKKGVFTIMNYLMPRRGLLSMHCSATADPKTSRSFLLFGLSGTGKTTLSADPKRCLIGDDEHVWSDDGIFNIEGGCYAKAMDLSEESEPDIFHALHFGAVLENVVFDDEDHEVDFTDISITENTRGAYPIEFIKNAKIPCVAGHPTDVIFLTCDAFGVLPPVSKLSPEQAMYHFISGYTAKIPGTEVGVREPQVTFSACFGSPFLVWHPAKYAELLARKLKEHDVEVWLVNTGWSGGSYGMGSRIQLSYTRSIIDAIHTGALSSARRRVDPVFGLEVITECPNVPAQILIPENTWDDKDRFRMEARKLAGLFVKNFVRFENGVNDKVKAAGPKV